MQFKNERKLWGPEAPVKRPEVIQISAKEHSDFWHLLNDIQVGHFDPEKVTKLNTWVIGSNGRWLVQTTPAGYFGAKVSTEGISTAYPLDLSEAFFDLKFGKIPESILNQILKFFRDIMAKYSNAEAFCQVYWDKEESKYLVHIPNQRVSKATVHYDATKNLDKINPQKYVFVYECHSHNDMRAFWSGTDNADEKELRFYGVFGQLDKKDYMNKHRAFVNEKELEINISDIFEITESEPLYQISNGEQNEVVPLSSISRDEVPRYNVLLGTGEIINVEKSQIKYIDKTEDIILPAQWFDAVNNVKNEIPQQFRGESSRVIFDKSPFMPKMNNEGVIYSEDNEEDDDDYRTKLSKDQEVYGEVERLTDEICQVTQDFEDLGACLIMFEQLEFNGALLPLQRALNHYSAFEPKQPNPEEDYHNEYYEDMNDQQELFVDYATDRHAI